jgi:hypothetical protein
VDDERVGDFGEREGEDGDCGETEVGEEDEEDELRNVHPRSFKESFLAVFDG